MRIDSTTLFPWAMTLGAVGDDNLLYEMGKEIANQCRFLGIHMNFAPVVDVNNNPKNPIIGRRSFGENPELVSNKALHYMRAFKIMVFWRVLNIFLVMVILMLILIIKCQHYYITELV